MFSFFVAFLLSFIFARHLCEFFLCCTYKKKNTVDHEPAWSKRNFLMIPLTQEDIDRYRNNYSKNKEKEIKLISYIDEKFLDLALKDQNIEDYKK